MVGFEGGVGDDVGGVLGVELGVEALLCSQE